jgi:molybdopterin-guanine dinucleotide biosynthesis protein A
MTMPTQRETIGIVLAGGESRRMQAVAAGVVARKELLMLAGQTFLERVVAIVAAEVGQVIVVAAPNQPLPALAGSVQVVRDSLPGSGPLAGIADGLRAATAAALAGGQAPPELAFVTACDVPLLRREVVRLLIDRARLSQAAWTVPLVDGHRQVLVSAVRPALLGRIEAWLATGRRDPRGLLAQMEAEHPGTLELVTEADLVVADPALESFLDVDTSADYDRVCRQLTYGKHGECPYTSPS